MNRSDGRTDSLVGSGGDLSVEQAQVLDEACDAFEAKWRAGGKPDILAALMELPEALRSMALKELIQLDVYYRRKAGALLAADDYAARFPDLDPDWLARAVAPSSGIALSAVPEWVGEFRVIREIGRGGMAVVFEAVQESLQRHVALKLLPAESAADPKRLERFRREARAAAKLHHTNIVPVFGVGEANGRHYYAMQFIAGHPLDAVLDEVRRLREKSATVLPPPAPCLVSEVARALATGMFAQLPDPLAAGSTRPPASTDGADPTSAPVAPAAAPARTDSSALSSSILGDGSGYFPAVARIGVQVADALTYAHGQGILHRDIKPANLLLDSRGTVWVTDFGLAKVADADDLTHAGDIVGTFRYMAPERFDGAGDGRADVYALGLTLYELLTLKPAFAADNRAKLVEQVLAASPPKPRSIDPAIPRDLETIVLKAMARDPAARYQSTAELAADLRRYLEDRPIRARRASRAEQAWRWCRRNPAVAMLLGAVLLVFAAGAAVSAYFAVQADSKAREATEREKEANTERDNVRAKEAKVRVEQDRLRRVLHASQMNQASAALAEERISRLLEILDETTPKPGEPDVRGWEWHYLDRLTRAADRSFSLVVPTDPSTSQSFPTEVLPPAFELAPSRISADGRRLVVFRADGTGYRFEVWDVGTGRLLTRLPREGPPLPLAKGTPWPRDANGSLGVDGRHFAVWFSASHPGEKTSPLWSLRIWDVDSGNELSAPAVHLPARFGGNDLPPNDAVPDAAGVRWLQETKVSGVPGFGPPLDPDTQSPEYLACRWDRKSGQVTSHRFRPGNGTGVLRPRATSANGRIVVFGGPTPPRARGASDRAAHFASNDNTTPPATRGAPGELELLECWNVAAGPPRLLWSLPCPRSADAYVRVSANGKMVASAGANGVTIYRAEGLEGKPVVEWQPDASLQKENGIPGLAAVSDEARPGLAAVSDEGRLVFWQSHTLTVIYRGKVVSAKPSHPPEMVSVTRKKILYHRGYLPAVRFTPDGRNLIAISASPAAVLVWDATGHPDLELPDSVAFTSPDGRWRLETPGPGQDFIPTQKAGGGFVLKDARTGAVTALLPGDSIGSNWGRVQFTADSRRVLIVRGALSRPSGADARVTFVEKWGLYDTNGLQQVAGGEYTSHFTDHLWDTPPGRPRMTASPGGRWVVEEAGEFVIRDGLTGLLKWQLKLPAGIAFVGYQFDATEDRVAVVTQPGTNDGQAAFSVRMCDAKTGEILWERPEIDRYSPLLAVKFSWGEFQVLFSPAGDRLLVGYRGPEWESRVWVARAVDGTTEQTLTTPTDMTIPRLSISRDGRRVAVCGGREVKVFSLETGELVTLLRGPEGNVFGTEFSPDGTRLFCVGTTPSEEKRTGTAAERRIHVWDLVTGRPLITLQTPVPSARYHRGGRKIEFQDGKLLLSGEWQKLIYDGTPVKE